MLRLLILMMLDAADKALKDLMMIDALSLSCANEHIPILPRVTTAKNNAFRFGALGKRSGPTK